MTKWATTPVLLALASVWLAGCGGGADAGPQCSTSSECAGGVCVDGMCVADDGIRPADASLPADSGAHDSGALDSGLTDGSLIDVAAPRDSAVDTGGPPAPYCGDGTCQSATESCSSCASDCGACAARCGDGVCNGTDTCGNCPGDCGGPCPVPAPAAPASIRASVGLVGYVALSWDAVSGAQTYQAYRCTNSATTSCSAITSWQGGTTYDDRGGTANVTYYYRAKARNCVGGVCAESVFSLYQHGSFVNATPPGRPVVRSVTNQSTSYTGRVNYSFAEPTTGGPITRYSVYKRIGNFATCAADQRISAQSPVGDGEPLGGTITGLAGGVRVCIAAQAEGPGGLGQCSAGTSSSCVTVAAGPAPGTPTNADVDNPTGGFTGRVRWSFREPTSGGPVSRYALYKRIGDYPTCAGSELHHNVNPVSPGASIAGDITGLTGHQVICIAVVAEGPGGGASSCSAATSCVVVQW